MITETQMVQAVANGAAGYGLMPEPLAYGVERWLRPGPQCFEEPWLMGARAVSEAEAGGEWRALVEVWAGEVDREALLARVREVMPAARFPSLQEVAKDLEPIGWLWEGWIPKGMITLVGAVPGAGKSFVALDLSRRVIGGEGWPSTDGEADKRMGEADNGWRVVYVDAEAVPQLINERAERWGMDRGRLFLMTPTRERLFVDFCDVEDREHLSEMCYRLGPALVVVDSLSSISSRGENSVEDVRLVLSFLNSLAQDCDCGLLLIHHLRKGSGLGGADDGVVGIDDFRGSGHIIAMARSVMGMSIVQTGPELDRNGPRRLEVVKTNLGPYPRAIGVEFVQAGDGVVLRYGEAPKAYQRPTTYDECGDWLLEVLEENGEPMRPREVVELGREAGWSRSVVYRARKELEGTVVDTGGRNDPTNQWALAEMVEEEEDADGED